jgi:hypothetical protein
MPAFHLPRRSALLCAARRLLAGLVVFGSSRVAAQKPAPPTPTTVRPEDALVNWNASIDALTKKVWPSVVQILVTGYGSPSGLRNTLTHGLVSAVARQIDPDSPLIYVQTDASINPGNSGGPLVNARGEVVGVNTFILSQTGGSDGLSFAIPVATARTVFRQFRQYGQLRRQEIGISTQTITPDMATALGLARDYGVIVSDVWPGGPAETAGLKVGDVLVSVDDQPAPSARSSRGRRRDADPARGTAHVPHVHTELSLTRSPRESTALWTARTVPTTSRPRASRTAHTTRDTGLRAGWRVRCPASASASPAGACARP